MWDKIDVKKLGVFIGGVIFGTAGIKLLSSKDAKKLYVNTTAAVLRARESVLHTATTVQENAEDILAEAQQLNDRMSRHEEICAHMPEETYSPKCEDGSATEEGIGCGLSDQS